MLVDERWPFRLHATYDESISRALDVFERVNRDQPFGGRHGWFDHAETVWQPHIERVARLNGGIAVQHRMACQGEYFVGRYGAGAAEAAPPIKAMLDAGVHAHAHVCDRTALAADARSFWGALGCSCWAF